MKDHFYCFIALCMVCVVFFAGFSFGEIRTEKRKLDFIYKIEIGEEKWFQLTNDLPFISIKKGEEQKNIKITEIKAKE